ncbi:hypothetical protein BBJ29_004405 [Phytophthora kernoviae]|uniref:BED-type domain-containing protein n=1 Tax=Phytophthora kernoviae TaxID=325452 RepID=A0A3R7MZI2_9STRA|nr:hypothetical protein BBJ29_004405 [Phytophthora kernoviae]
MELSSAASESALGKRTGRPVHPVWAHFHRGEKRNRYHYHAYCSYCLDRHGTDQVPPTRGVSSDMLRHLESCPNCPRKVVETMKDLCGRRERNAQAKKQANRIKYGIYNRLGTSVDDDQVLLLEAATTAASSVTVDVSVAVTSSEIDLQVDSEAIAKRATAEALVDERPVEAIPRLSRAVAISDGAKRVTTKRQSTGRSIGDTTGFLTLPVKQVRTESDGAGRTEENTLTKWQMGLLQTAVVAGIPLSAFQKSEFQELLRVLCPVQIDNDAVISAVGSQTFVEETAAKLTRSQLDRVKEGMTNSTIKSGLTLSVSCWQTRDLQQLVAFSLVNSNGDAACVRVEDIGGHVQQQHSAGDDDDESPMALLLPLTNAIADVLLELSEKNIHVMGIVADSAVALSAAKRVCRSPQWRPLMVVPCFSALLTSLAGSVLTHETFRVAVGQLVELAAYFSNSRLQAALCAISGEDDARIPLPTKEHWFSFVPCLTKTLHYSGAITAMCSSQEEGGSPLAPLALRKLTLSDNGQIWKTFRELDLLLAPLREAYSLVFQAKLKLDEVNSADDSEEFTTAVHGGLTLAHIMYQLGRMSQQYAALAESAEINSVSTSSNSDTSVVAHRLHELLDFIWQRYDLPAMVLAFVFDFHLDTGRLDMSNSALQWKAVAAYFELYFQRWFCQPQEHLSQPASDSTLVAPLSSRKVEEILNTYQLRQFPFDSATANDYTDVSSFYSFVSDSHPEICALCCRVYAVALASADVRRVVRGIGFVHPVAQTTARPEQVELLLHIGFASSLKRVKNAATVSPDSHNILPQLIQASRPTELLCSQDEWEEFADEWRLLLDHEMDVDELEQLQQLHEHETTRSIGSRQGKSDEVLRLPLNQIFFEALPPLPAAVVVAPSPHDPAGTLHLTARKRTFKLLAGHECKHEIIENGSLPLRIFDGSCDI